MVVVVVLALLSQWWGDQLGDQLGDPAVPAEPRGRLLVPPPPPHQPAQLAQVQVQVQQQQQGQGQPGALSADHRPGVESECDS